MIDTCYFDILRSAIWSTPLDTSAWPPAVDMRSLVAGYREQALLVLVSPVLLSLPEPYALPVDLQMDILQSVAASTQMHYTLRSEIAAVTSLLRGHGIFVLVLKGEPLATLYPNPDLRACGDIDLWVAPADYRRAIELLQAYTGDPGHEDFLERHYQLYRGDVKFELHQHPGFAANGFHASRYARLADRYFRSASFGAYESVSLADTMVAVPSAQFSAWYLLSHLLHHLQDGGVGLRQFVDWMLLLHTYGPDIDPQLLRRELDSLGLLRAWRRCLPLLSVYLGLPAATAERFAFGSISDSPSLRREVSRFVEAGNFGTAQRDASAASDRSRWSHRWRVLSSTFRRAAQLWYYFPMGAVAFVVSTFRMSLRASLGLSHDTVFTS